MQSWVESISDRYALKLTTLGRRTGLKRVTTIWFGIIEGRLYVSSGRGENSDWVKNIKKDGRVEVTIGGATKHGLAQIEYDPRIKSRLRKLYWKKYHVLMTFAEFGKMLMRIPPKVSIPLSIAVDG
jgi:deazaflavin-dependent oxidoreductase (nitroreductase family)